MFTNWKEYFYFILFFHVKLIRDIFKGISKFDAEMKHKNERKQ